MRRFNFDHQGKMIDTECANKIKIHCPYFNGTEMDDAARRRLLKKTFFSNQT